MGSQKQFEKLRWDETYSSGLVYLDNHRRNFFDIVNELVEVANEERCESSLTLIFQRLAFYVENYFVNKEIAMMGNSDLPLQSYKQEHARFTDEISRHHQEIHNGNIGACRELVEFLIAWFENYIRLFEPEAVEYLRQKGFE